ncbi:unnamed protein product, partial [Mesorhabditis belari]|uniref:SSD domain-containing protein n=1 Tax=Mesorhabditis belari TaxID=2138241 RepID=A0AAF3FS45_9BILA
MGASTWIDDHIHQIFFRFGLICHRYRLPLLIASIIFTCISSIGLIWIEKQTTNDPEYVFSPEGAPWRKERAILSQNWPLDEERFWPGKSYDLKGFVDVIVAGNVIDEWGRPNILSLRYLDEVARVNDYIIHNLTIPINIDGKKYEAGYIDLCMRFEWKCFFNDHLTMLMPKSRWGNFSAAIAEFAHDIITKEVNITYPIGWKGTEPIYFGALVGGPHLKDEEGHFDYAKAIRLTYNTREEKIGNISYLWRKKLTDYLTSKRNPPSELLDIGMFHNESLPEGLQDVADALTPKFIGTCTILIIFCYSVSIVLIRHENGVLAIDWVRSKPIVAFAGLMCPLMAVATSFGLVLWFGALYNAIVNVSPFLVLAIGIDDMFIMVAVWHRTNPELSPARRMAETLQEAAVAITITSVTDITTFAIGMFTPLPGVRMFCLYTCVQVIFTYIYQLTFFSPILAYSAEMEDQGKHSLFFTKALEPSQADANWKLHFLAGSVSRKASFKKKVSIKLHTDEEGKTEEKGWIGKVNGALRKLETKLEHHESDIEGIKREDTMVNRLFKEIIGPFILEKTTQWCALAIFCIYLGFAILGCCQIREGLSPRFLVRDSFYLSNFYKLIDETFWNEGLQMQVIVSEPPDFSDPAERAEFSSLVRSFEHTEYTMGHNATMLWLTAYERYLREQQEENHIEKPTNKSEWYKRCKEWVLIAGGRRLWEMDMVWGAGADQYTLKAFRFQVGLRHYNTPVDHTNSCKLMRSIAAQFVKFNVTTFHEYYPFADQYLELKPSLTRNFVMGLLSMFIVTVIMIPDWRAALAVVLAIGSINIGVLGYMTFWGVNLDSVSVITVIMCVGFAVDLSAHIAYAYSQSYGTAHERAVESLEALGWPVFLGASSTILGICVLTLVDSYIVQIFFKTVFLVISFSMLHGLLFLPIILMFIIPEERRRTTQKQLHPSVNAIEADIEFPPRFDSSKSGSSPSSRKNSGDLTRSDNDPEEKLQRRSRASSLASLKQTLETIGEGSEDEESETEHEIDEQKEKPDNPPKDVEVGKETTKQT